MDTPPLDDLPPAMPGHGSSTFRGARASLNPRFSPVRTPLKSRTSHEHVQHSRQGQCALCDKLQAQTLHRRIARRGPSRHCNSTRHGCKGACSAASCETTTDTTPTPGGALRPLDPGSFALACEPARRPRWAGRPDSSIRQSGGAARTSRSQSFSPISMLVMQRGKH